MSNKGNKTDHVNTEKSLDAANTAVFHKGRKLTKEQFIVVSGIVVILLIAVSIGTAVLWKMKGLDSSTDNPSVQKNPVENQPSALKVNRQVEDARAEELKGLIGSETDKQKKATYLNELLLIHYNRDEFDEALQLATEAEGVNPTALSAGALGDIYYEKKEYDLAVKHYSIAMSRTEKPANSSIRSPYNEYAALKKQAEDAQ